MVRSKVWQAMVWLLAVLCLGASLNVAAVVLPVPLHHVPDHQQPLGLEDAILLSMRSNPAVINARLDRVVQQFALRMAYHQFEPQWSLQASTERQYALSSMASTGAHLMPSVSYQSPFGTKWAVDVSQNYVSPVTGANYQSTTATASVTQPLLKGAGSVASYPLLDAKGQEVISQKQYRQNIMAQITAVIKSYHQLVRAYHTVTINRMAMQDSLRELDHFKLKQQLGKVANADLLTQESQVASQRLALIGSEDALNESRQSLLTLLGLDPHMSLNPVFDIDLQQASKPLPNQEACVNMALANDMAYQAALSLLEQAKRHLKAAKQNTWWQLDLTASTSITRRRNRGPETQSATGDKSVGLKLSIPVDGLADKQALAQAEVGLQSQVLAVQTAKNAAETKIINQLRRLASQKMQVTLAERAVGLAQQTLANAKLKLQYGRASAFEVTTLREALTNKQLAVVAAKISYVDTYADVSQALGRTLDFWHIKLQEGVS